MRNIFYMIMSLLFLSLTIAPAARVSAENLQITPSVSIREDYNDNIFFNVNNAEEDYITTLIMGLEGSNRTERLNLKFRGMVLPFQYSTNDELNDVDMDFKAKFDYQLTPRFSVNSKGAFRVDNRPDREIYATGLAFENDQRHRYRAGAGAGLELTETIDLSLSYTYDQDDWRNENQNPNRQDYEGNTVSLVYMQNISRWLRASNLVVNLGYGNYNYDTSDTDSAFANIGIQSMISEIFQAQIYAGARFTDSSYALNPAVPDETRDNSSWSGIGSLGLTYAGERTDSSLTLSKDLRTASGNLGPADLTKAILEIDHRVLERFSIGISASYFLNKAEANEYASNPTDLTTYHIRPRIRWQFLDQFSLEAGYHYTHLNNNITDSEAEQHVAYLQLGFSYSLFDLIENIGNVDHANPSDEYGWADLR